MKLSNKDMDSTPISGRVRQYFAGQHFDVLVIAELMDDGWRGRWHYSMRIGTRKVDGSKVGAQRFATGDDAFNAAFESVMACLGDNYSWTAPAMIKIRSEMDSTIGQYLRWLNTPKTRYKLWQS